MPTNFTVVPVKDGTSKVNGEDEEEDVDDNNALKDVEEDAAGETPFRKLHLAALLRETSCPVRPGSDQFSMTSMTTGSSQRCGEASHACCAAALALSHDFSPSISTDEIRNGCICHAVEYVGLYSDILYAALLRRYWSSGLENIHHILEVMSSKTNPSPTLLWPGRSQLCFI